jgi:hypothetical protein
MRLSAFDRRMLEVVRLPASMDYEARQVVLSEFEVLVTRWKKDRYPKFAIDWTLDRTDYS